MKAKAQLEKTGITGQWRPPLFQGILPLDKSRLAPEIIAGITLAALGIPEVLGYTKISGTPVITGLYTMLLPAALFAIFGSSRHLVVAADSATAAILAAGLVGLASAGSNEYVALAGVLAFMAAGFLILARVIGLGFMADFLSRTVLVGFLTGVGMQVALSQLSGMLGLAGGGRGALEKVWSDLQQADHVNVYALAITLSVLLVIVGSKKVSKRIPGPLIALTGAIALSWGLGLGKHVRVLGSVPSGLPHFGLPHMQWSLNLIQRLVPTAFAMFVVILAQSAATSRAYAARYSERFSQNVDLVGLSIANIGAGLTGAFVVNGSPTKTEMVTSAGGSSQLAQIATCVIVLLVLLFLTKPLEFMPEAVLAAVVFLIGVALIDIKGMRAIYRERPVEFWVAVLAALTVVIVGVEQGILLAMFLSLVSHTRHGYRPQNALIVTDPSGRWSAQPVNTHLQLAPGLLVYRFSHGMYYANARILSEEITWLVDKANPRLKWFCIDVSAVDDVDYTAAATLRSLVGQLGQDTVKLVFSGVSPGVLAQLERSGIPELVGGDAFYATAAEAAEAYRKLAQVAPYNESGPSSGRPGSRR
jgi:SulP family sulfate permease